MQGPVFLWQDWVYSHHLGFWPCLDAHRVLPHVSSCALRTRRAGAAPVCLNPGSLWSSRSNVSGSVLDLHWCH